MKRLNKFIAEAGLASRREADTMISAGRVMVNNEVVRELGRQINPEQDRVSLDNRPVFIKQDFQYLILNKPPGYLTTVTDPHGRSTVMELLPQTNTRLYPVGRLDLDTSGLLFFTNDGALALALTHPRHLVTKVYLAKVRGVPSEAQLEDLAKGIRLTDGLTAPAKLALEAVEKGNAILRVTLREGRKRQVKRMLGSIGHPVITLQRVAFGPLQIGELALGETRSLSGPELEALMELKTKIQAGSK